MLLPSRKWTKFPVIDTLGSCKNALLVPVFEETTYCIQTTYTQYLY